MYEATVPCLYESISFYTTEEDLGNIDVSKLSAAGENGLLRYTRHIKFWSHFHRKTSNRCMHMTEDNYDGHGSKTKENVAQELKCLLRACEPGKIRSFE